MAMLSKEEFIEKTQTLTAADLTTSANWLGSAASVTAAIAMNHDQYSKELIVETLQILALRMPTELVTEATVRMMFVANGLHDL